MTLCRSGSRCNRSELDFTFKWPTGFISTTTAANCEWCTLSDIGRATELTRIFFVAVKVSASPTGERKLAGPGTTDAMFWVRDSRYAQCIQTVAQLLQEHQYIWHYLSQSEVESVRCSSYRRRSASSSKPVLFGCFFAHDNEPNSCILLRTGTVNVWNFPKGKINQKVGALYVLR